ncbi:hypothetical protein chiPu_0022268 [Chiloscyllium punctatum]|uniref:Uncharacterized protein n=1 Tax=Chiloscyllium punctatum TaxID=137246 RepID=A0A401RGR6_CHIPU|nr:hypothetical protein [Chiloscyllium punctatum]
MGGARPRRRIRHPLSPAAAAAILYSGRPEAALCALCPSLSLSLFLCWLDAARPRGGGGDGNSTGKKKNWRRECGGKGGGSEEAATLLPPLETIPTARRPILGPSLARPFSERASAQPRAVRRRSAFPGAGQCAAAGGSEAFGDAPEQGQCADSAGAAVHEGGSAQPRAVRERSGAFRRHLSAQTQTGSAMSGGGEPCAHAQ